MSADSFTIQPCEDDEARCLRKGPLSDIIYIFVRVNSLAVQAVLAKRDHQISADDKKYS